MLGDANGTLMVSSKATIMSSIIPDGWFQSEDKRADSIDIVFCVSISPGLIREQ
jgi:hypothetical protein